MRINQWIDFLGKPETYLDGVNASYVMLKLQQNRLKEEVNLCFNRLIKFKKKKYSLRVKSISFHDNG